MLKTTRLLDILRLEVGNGNGKILGFGISDNDSIKIAKKSRKSNNKNLSQF